MFRRRRSEDADRDEFDYDEPEQPAGVPRAEGGPWDAEEPFPALERVDLGSLQVPVGPEHEIQLVMAEQHGAWVTVRYRESEVQIQAFAAARRGALWDDVRAEIAAEVDTAGGRSQETEGSFGIELMAQVPAEPGQPGRRACGWSGSSASTGPAGSCAGCSPARPRTAATRPTCSKRCSGTSWWSAVSTRCRRGRYSSCGCRPRRGKRSRSRPPRNEENRFRGDLNPFERGPEFTETR